MEKYKAMISQYGNSSNDILVTIWWIIILWI